MLNPKKVTEYLAEVSYSGLDGYVPSTFALEMLNLIKLISGHDSMNVTPTVHLKMLDSFIDASKLDVINLCHRGLGKSTLLEFLIFRIALYGDLPNLGKVPYMLYVSDSIDNGVKKMRKSLEYRYHNSDFLKEYISDIKFTDTRWEFLRKDGTSLVVSGHGAKALSLDSILYTEQGTTTIGECRVGDKIYGADGKLCTITRKSEVFNKPMYLIELADGRSIKVSEDHINSVMVRGKHSHEKVRCDITTQELLKLPLTHTRDRITRKTTENLVFIENCKPVEFPTQVLPIDPYTLGVILGDGRVRKDCGSVEITGHINDFPTYTGSIPYTFGKFQIDNRNPNVRTQSIRGLGHIMKSLGLNVHGDFKFIPSMFKRASIEQRLNLLQGLMDTDGTIGDRVINPVTSFCSNSEQLVKDVMDLVYSLGGYCILGKTGKAFRVQIHLNMPLFKLPRKLDKQKFNKKTYVAISKITSIPLEPSQCIAVDNDEHQFITGMFVRTHNTGVRGTRENGSRPVLALLDDLISDEDARSPTMIESIRTTVNSAIEPSLDPNRRKIIWNGTPFNASDPLYVAVESGAWLVNAYPICEKYPCTREEFRGSWEERFSFDYVETQFNKLKLQGAEHSFYQEYMLQIMSEGTRLIQDSDIKWYSKKALMNNKSNFNFYITTDFATSEKQHSDYSFISVWAVNNKGFKYWVDGICKRQTMDKNIDDLFKLAQQYSPQSVGIEVSGQQNGFVSWIEQEMMRRNIYFSLASESNEGRAGIRPTTSKLQRFNIVVPYFKMGEMYFPIEMKGGIALDELLEELSLTTVGGFKSRHDDGLDTISMLALMPIWLPSDSTEFKSDRAGIWRTPTESGVEYSTSYFC